MTCLWTPGAALSRVALCFTASHHAGIGSPGRSIRTALRTRRRCTISEISRPSLPQRALEIRGHTGSMRPFGMRERLVETGGRFEGSKQWSSAGVFHCSVDSCFFRVFLFGHYLKVLPFQSVNIGCFLAAPGSKRQASAGMRTPLWVST